MTEALSIFHLFTVASLATAWFFIDVLFAGLLYRLKEGAALTTPWPDLFPKWHTDKAFVMSIGVIIALVGLTALIYPPDNSDAMSYHMPRIVHWLHNRVVGFYATGDLRQLSLQPWAEYAIAHIHARYGSDRWDNLVQWFSMFGCVMGVSLIAKLLGARRRGQVLLPLLCATIPQGVLAASTVMKTTMSSSFFWLVALTYYLLAFRQDHTLINLVGIGGAMGLACLTKGTAFFFAPPIMIAMMLLWKWPESVAYVRYLLFAGVLALLINAGFLARNYHSVPISFWSLRL